MPKDVNVAPVLAMRFGGMITWRAAPNPNPSQLGGGRGTVGGRKVLDPHARGQRAFAKFAVSSRRDRADVQRGDEAAGFPSRALIGRPRNWLLGIGYRAVRRH